MMSLHTAWVPPSLEQLTAVLSVLLAGAKEVAGPIAVVRREPEGHGSFPKEVVTCDLNDGTTMRLFVKYEAGYEHGAHGHRGGVAHEVAVYQRLLRPLGVVVPSLYGVYRDMDRHELWLVLEYLDDSMHVHQVPELMGAAASWIGRFHAACQSQHAEVDLSILRPYREDYYLGWSQRTWNYLGGHPEIGSWLEKLCKGFEAPVAALLSAPLTAVHGEYYPLNILCRDGLVYPLDWESAALAAGEIDLASLIEGWPDDVVQECTREYVAARWPEGVPAGFQHRLWAARLYLQFRWLGDSPEAKRRAWRLEALQTAGRELGLVG